MSSSNSFDSPMRSQGGYGDFLRPKFSPVFTSSPRIQNQSDSSDFIPFGPSPPGNYNRGRGRWKGRNRGSLLNMSSSSGHNSFSPNMGHRSSPYTPYRQNNNRGPRRGRGFQGYPRNRSQGSDMSAFYHPSMLEDPWAELEEKLRNSGSDASNSKNPTAENAQDSNTESSVDRETSIELSSQEHSSQRMS